MNSVALLKKYTDLLLLPVVSFALLVTGATVSAAPLDTLQETVSDVGGLINTAVIIVISLIFLFFFWSLGQYVLKSEGKEDAKTNMIWAVVALFVITSVWGLIAFIRALVGVDAGTANDIAVPGVDFPG